MTINITRRGIIGGAAALAALSIIPPEAKAAVAAQPATARPRIAIWADGCGFITDRWPKMLSARRFKALGDFSVSISTHIDVFEADPFEPPDMPGGFFREFARSPAPQRLYMSMKPEARHTNQETSYECVGAVQRSFIAGQTLEISVVLDNDRWITSTVLAVSFEILCDEGGAGWRLTGDIV